MLERYGVEHNSQNPESNRKKGESNAFTYQQVKEFVEQNSNAILLSESYSRSTQILDFKCECGEDFKATLVAFKHENKRQCNACGIAKRSKENSPRWKGGITPEEEKIRKSEEYANWRNAVFKRDNYTCQACGDCTGGNLHAHHVLNFSSNPELRFDVENGVTLCDPCHNPNKEGSFHHKYGTTGNTREQLEEFIAEKKTQLLNV